MNTKIFTLAAFFIASSAFAQVPASTTSEVAAQANITRDSINDLLAKIGSKTISGYEAADYLAQLPTFKAQTAQAMESFQAELENNILKKVDFWVSRYNGIYGSPEYSADQKRVLLAQQRSIIEGQIGLIQIDYQAAVKKVYRLFQKLPTQLNSISGRTDIANDMFHANNDYISQYSITFSSLDLTQTVKGKTKRGQEKLQFYSQGPSYGLQFNHHTLDLREKQVSEYPLVILKTFEPATAEKLYLETAYPLFSEGCRSQICLGLKASDYGSLLSMVAQSIDRDLQIKLADETIITLKSVKFQTKLAQDLLSNVDYPAEGKALPFDTK